MTDYTSPVKAIETRYAGCHFRSRLEARWAVFFDAAGIRWEYEPEGFEDTRWCDSDGVACSPIRYLPDFYLPATETWVEVKGTNKAIREDIDRLEMFLDWNSPLPGMQDSDGTDRGLLLLGPIPRVDGDMSKRRSILHPLIQHREGLWLNYWSFTAGPKGGLCYDTGDGLCVNEIDIEEIYAPKDVGPEHAWSLPGWAVAYIAARSARFEHGQSG